LCRVVLGVQTAWQYALHAAGLPRGPAPYRKDPDRLTNQTRPPGATESMFQPLELCCPVGFLVEMPRFFAGELVSLV